MKRFAPATLALSAFLIGFPASGSSSSKAESKPAAHGTSHGKPEAKHETKPAQPAGHAAKPAAHEAKPGGHDAKPAPVVKTESPKPAPPPTQIPVPKPSPLAKPVSAPVRSSWSAPKRVAAPLPAPAPAPVQLAPIPVKVEVVQEATPPTRVEAVLHVVPHIPGMAPSTVKLPPGASHVEVPVTLASAPQPSPAFAEPPPSPAHPPVRIVTKNTLTNEGLVLLARAGYEEDFLIDLMRIKRCRFDTSVEGLAYLANQGISERLVKAALRLEVQSRSE